MAKTDTEQYKPRLRNFLRGRSISINENKTPNVIRCPNPSHADEHPSAVIYDDKNNVYCPVCGESWDIFEVAGLLDGLSDFPAKLEAVKNTLGDSTVKPADAKNKSKKQSRPKAKLVPITREKANEIFNPTALVDSVKKFKWLDGDVRFIKVWPYLNDKGLIEMFDVRFENEHGKKAVITFFWDGKVMRGSGAPILLFNRDRLKAAPDLPILIVEGAKTAEAAADIPGFIPMTWNGGGKKCKLADWTPLKNRTVYIYPDDDQKHYPDDHRKHPGELKPWNEQPGFEAAFMIKKKLPNAKVIKPLEAARQVKADGADIVEAIQVLSAEDLREYILNAPEVKPPEPASSPIDTPRTDIEPEAFPFRILGVADDGKGYFLDRHERLTSMALGSITQNKLLTLASLTFWEGEFANGRGGKMSRDDWTDAVDAVIQLAGHTDFNPDIIRGRGAWRERDGRICYHDGLNTIGDASQERLYLRMTRKDIGIDTGDADLSALTAILAVTAQLSFETRADTIRCIAWSTLAPFAGALPWRPAGFLTGRSESGKSTIVDMIVKPLSRPMVFSGGETTEAGVRQTIKNDAVAIVVEEAETDTPKKRQRRNDILSLMRQSTSDETPKAAKGTIDGKGMMFTLRSMFLFVAISPEIESIADDNRLFRINLKKNDNNWISLKTKLGELLTPEVCAGVRAFTWSRLKDIFELADRMSPIIQHITNKSARFATAESLLFASYQVVWKRDELTDDDLRKFFDKIYEWQPVEQPRNEEDELLDKLLDYIVREGRDNLTLRQVLIKCKATDIEGHWKSVAGRYGLRLTQDGDIAIAKNHESICRILDKGKGYQRTFFRHDSIKIENKNISVGGKVRACLVLDGKVLDGKPDDDGEPF